jgi:glycyl-tRNA synthetase beta subunit
MAGLWQNYRNGNARESRNFERLARHWAAKLGYRVHRSRRRKGRHNGGEFMLIHKASSTALPGAEYTANVQMILEFMEWERPMTINNKVRENVRPPIKRVSLTQSDQIARTRMISTAASASRS